MKQMRIALLGLAAVLAALLLIACGGDDSGDETSAESGTALTDEDYSAEVQEVTSSFAGGFDELSAEAANPESPEAFRETVIAIQDRITQTVDELEAIEPPEDLATIHDELVAVFADYRDGYDPIVEALDAEDKAALKQAAAEIPVVVQEFQTTYEDIKARAADAGVTIEEETAPTGY